MACMVIFAALCRGSVLSSIENTGEWIETVLTETDPEGRDDER